MLAFACLFFVYAAVVAFVSTVVAALLAGVAVVVAALTSKTANIPLQVSFSLSLSFSVPVFIMPNNGFGLCS